MLKLREREFTCFKGSRFDIIKYDFQLLKRKELVFIKFQTNNHFTTFELGLDQFHCQNSYLRKILHKIKCFSK